MLQLTALGGLLAAPQETAPSKAAVLSIDVGGSNVKLTARCCGEQMVKIPSGRTLSAKEMVDQALEATRDWHYDCITLGFPGLVRDARPVREPLNLGGGWLDFDYEKAFGKPVRFINDAALQALAAYRGGRMLFIGFGTSTGCALVADGMLTSLETGIMRLPSGQRYMDRLSKAARRERGHEKWQRDVFDCIEQLKDIFWPEDMVIGGGNAKHLDPLPPGCRRTSNREIIVGAERLWHGGEYFAEDLGTSWRLQLRSEVTSRYDIQI